MSTNRGTNTASYRAGTRKSRAWRLQTVGNGLDHEVRSVADVRHGAHEDRTQADGRQQPLGDAGHGRPRPRLSDSDFAVSKNTT